MTEKVIASLSKGATKQVRAVFTVKVPVINAMNFNHIQPQISSNWYAGASPTMKMLSTSIHLFRRFQRLSLPS